MTTDEAALRAAILDAPQDDAPRLVYADWLDEHGQPERAEFIRVQCALARIDEESDPVRYDLEKRQVTLLKKHQRQWLAPYKLKPDDVEFRRGFVSKLLDASRRRPAQLDAILANEPLSELEWNTVEDHAERLFRSPRMEHITHLDCSSISLDETQVSHLLDFPGWKRVRSLNLG